MVSGLQRGEGGIACLAAPYGRRQRVDDGAAADGAGRGLVAQDEAVAMECRHRFIQHQLRDTLAARRQSFAAAQ
jgi:hypothetical protein